MIDPLAPTLAFLRAYPGWSLLYAVVGFVFVAKVFRSTFSDPASDGRPEGLWSLSGAGGIFLLCVLLWPVVAVLVGLSQLGYYMTRPGKFVAPPRRAANPPPPPIPPRGNIPPQR